MLRVWRWDEVQGEVDQADLPVTSQDPPYKINDANNALCDYEPTGEYDKIDFVDFPTFRLIVGRWGRDKQYMIWWGDPRDCQRFADLLDPH